MNVDTGSFQALREEAARADGYLRREALLIRTLARVLCGEQDLPDAPRRPRLRLIRGGAS